MPQTAKRTVPAASPAKTETKTHSAPHELAVASENFELAIEAARMLVRQYPDLVLGYDCGNELRQIKALKESEHSNDEQQRAFQLDEARECFRRYPSLVIADEMPEPWRGILAEFEAGRAAGRS